MMGGLIMWHDAVAMGNPGISTLMLIHW